MAVHLLAVRPVHDEEGIVGGQDPRLGVPRPQVGLSGQGGQEERGVLVEILLRQPDLRAPGLDPLVEPVEGHLRRGLHQLRLVGEDVEDQADIVLSDDPQEVLLVQLELVGVRRLAGHDGRGCGQVVQNFDELPVAPLGQPVGLDVLPLIEVSAEADHVLLEILEVLPLLRRLLRPQLLPVDAVVLDVERRAGRVLRHDGLGKPFPHDPQLLQPPPLEVHPGAEHRDDAQDDADSGEDGAVVQDGCSDCEVKPAGGARVPPRFRIEK